MLRQILFTKTKPMRSQNFVFRETEQSLSEALDETNNEAMELPVDLVRSGSKLILKSPIVGAGIHDINITISADQIVISKSGIQEQASGGEHAYLQECHWGALSRTINLPKSIDPDRTKASLHEGILTIIMPIAVKSHTKTLEIQE